MNGDGEVDIVDIATITLAFGSQPGDPNWDPDADLNGDGLIDIVDVTTATIDFGKEANRIGGSYSWYTSGGGNYKMWQWLDSDTIQAVAGQKVMFGFWFYPKYALSGNQSDPTETSVSHGEPAWISVSNLTYTPPSGQRIRLRKVQLDTRVTSLPGYYKITYIKEDGAETVIVTNQLITNTEYQTKKHATNVLGDEGKSITVKFYLFQSFDEPRPTFAKNFYMFYDGGVDARAEIYYEYAGGSNTVYGEWVTPTEFEWNKAHVTASLPSATTAVKVIIHGKPDFKAWIDQASLSINTGYSFDPSDGLISLQANIFQYQRMGVTYDGRVVMGIGLAYECKDAYAIGSTKLKVELLPDGDSPQDGQLDIEYVEQANDRNYDVDPAANERFNNFAVSAAELAFWGIATSVAIVVMPPDAPITTKFLVTSAIKGTTVIFNAFRTNPDERHADGGADNAVWEQWDYPTRRSNWDFVQMATGYYELQWIFNTESAESFQIRITSTVRYGLPVYDQVWQGWIMYPIYEVTASTVITIEA